MAAVIAGRGCGRVLDLSSMVSRCMERLPLKLKVSVYKRYVRPTNVYWSEACCWEENG